TERDRLLREALALWRGPALNRPATDPLRQRLCADLDELHLQAHERSLAIGIELGRHHKLVGDLARLRAEHPTRQRLTELHMLALYRSGRTADALDIYHRTRDRLAEHLGIDPDATLQQMYTAILRGEPVPAVDTMFQAAPGGCPVPQVIPAQLPAAPAGFAGRSHHLDQLDALLPDPHLASGTTAVVTTAVDGTAGV